MTFAYTIFEPIRKSSVMQIKQIYGKTTAHISLILACPIPLEIHILQNIPLTHHNDCKGSCYQHGVEHSEESHQHNYPAVKKHKYNDCWCFKILFHQYINPNPKRLFIVVCTQILRSSRT